MKILPIFIFFFTVNLSGSQCEIRRPSAEKIEEQKKIRDVLLFFLQVL
jgi:hypothetical protein